MSNILILDGGLGTSLEQKYKVRFDDSKPLWSSHLLLQDQEVLARCQKDFADVPVDIILTATYQLSLEAFEDERKPNSSVLIQKAINDSVRIVEDVKQPQTQIALSIGPYGATMRPSQEYSGKYDTEMDDLESLYRWHHQRLEVFATSITGFVSRVNLVALETIPRIDEIKALRLAMAKIPELSKTPFWMSCLFPGEAACLPDGATVEDAVRAMLDPELSKSLPWAVGINCTKVWKLDFLLRQYESAIGKMIEEGRLSKWPSLVIYPDGTNGEVYDTVSKEWALPKGATVTGRGSWEDQLADVVGGTRARAPWPAIIVGGCCMASAEHILRLRRKILS